jgi:ABC-type Na+ efflux pump permease subunit
MSPQILIFIHAGMGEIGAIAFLWALIELLNSTPQRVNRAKIAILIGVVFLFASWLVGGYYYVDFYGGNVKPFIKEGPQPWAHSVVTETKEHVFLFLPFLALFAYGFILRFGDALSRKKELARALVVLCGLIVLIAFAMAGMGYIISSGFRSALEVQVL